MDGIRANIKDRMKLRRGQRKSRRESLIAQGDLSLRTIVALKASTYIRVSVQVPAICQQRQPKFM